MDCGVIDARPRNNWSAELNSHCLPLAMFSSRPRQSPAAGLHSACNFTTKAWDEGNGGLRSRVMAATGGLRTGMQCRIRLNQSRHREVLFRSFPSTLAGPRLVTVADPYTESSALPTSDAAPPVLRFGPFCLDQANARLTRGGAALEVVPKDLDVLCHLAQRPGRLVTKDELLDAVWERRFVSESVLKNVVSRLRALLGDDARNPR